MLKKERGRGQSGRGTGGMEETGKERREGGTGWRRDEGKQAEDGVAGALWSSVGEKKEDCWGLGSVLFEGTERKRFPASAQAAKNSSSLHSTRLLPARVTLTD